MCSCCYELQLLSKPKYSGVEKIKTIGSTYMAATGLQRCKIKRKVSNKASKYFYNIFLYSLNRSETAAIRVSLWSPKVKHIRSEWLQKMTRSVSVLFEPFVFQSAKHV